MLEYKMSFKADKVLGTAKENELVAYLNNHTDDIYHLYKNKNSVYDFMNGEYICELKTRRNNKDAYPDTMVGYNKIKEAEEDVSVFKYRFYFIFTDGTYYWDFVRDNYRISMGGRRDRGRPEFKEYAYIDVSQLTLLTTEINSY